MLILSGSKPFVTDSVPKRIILEKLVLKIVSRRQESMSVTDRGQKYFNIVLVLQDE